MRGRNMLFMCVLMIIVLFFVFIYVSENRNLLESFGLSIVTPLILWFYAPVVTGIERDLSKVNYCDIVMIPYLLERDITPIFYSFIASLLLGLIVMWIGVSLKSNTYSSKGIVKQFNRFISDASELIVVGKDLSFIKESKVQKDKIKSLKGNCMILCSKEYSDNDLGEFIELYSKDVNIKVYENDFGLTFRGQIKRTQNSYEGMYVDILPGAAPNKKKYKLSKINNRDILSHIEEGVKRVHNNSRNPIVKVIALDLDGVYFDGSYGEFLKQANIILKSNVPERSENNVCLSQDLNKGEINIIEYLERQGCDFDEEKANTIKELWSQTWKPNSKLKELFCFLNEKGYKIIPFSNLDEQNGDSYLLKSYFPFSDSQVFSYIIKFCKPDKEFFSSLERTEDVEPDEVILIDDQSKVIKSANSRGWKTIKFPKPSTDKFDDMVVRLVKEGIMTLEDEREIRGIISAK